MRVLLTALAAALALVAPASAQSRHLVVNEIEYNQPGVDTAEYLEIRNSAAVPVDLGPHALHFVNGASGGATTYLTADLLAVDLAAGGYYVVCGDPSTVPECDQDIGVTSNLIQNGDPDAVAIVDGAGAIVDTVSYGGAVPGYTEGPAGAPTDLDTALQSLGRVPDGCDTMPTPSTSAASRARPARRTAACPAGARPSSARRSSRTRAPTATRSTSRSTRT
jgi:hypothetical protein